MILTGKKLGQRKYAYIYISSSPALTERGQQDQTFMVIGAAGELPKAPTEPIKFLEDMNDIELADAVGSNALTYYVPLNCGP